MEKMNAKKAAKILKGKFFGPESLNFSGVSIDSRQIQKGNLFVAIKGEIHDGHDYLEQVWEKGAAGSLVSRDITPPPGKFIIRIDDTLRGLQELAGYYRTLFDPLVIGITGTNGKTTTKDFIAAITAEEKPTLKTPGNLNNQYGLPLTLLKLGAGKEFAVVEMGMNAPGEIALLSSIARPKIGVLTNIGPAHLEFLTDLEGVAKAKGEMVESLPADGALVFNGDDPYATKIAQTYSGKKVSFGFGDNNLIKGEEIKRLGYQNIALGVSIRDDYHLFRLPLLGKHNAYNALAAIGVGWLLGISLSKIGEGLLKAELSGNRMEIKKMPQGYLMINDSYNANPTSMKHALEILSEIAVDRSIALLGDMLELGVSSEKYHREIGYYLAELNIDLLLTRGPGGKIIGQGAREKGFPARRIINFQDNDQALDFLRENLTGKDTLLIKGSRGLQLEKIAQGLKGWES